MNCQDARVLLHALLDDELDAAAGLEVTRHLANCAACKLRFQHHEQLRAGLRAARLYRPAPVALRARILAQWPRPRRASGPLPRAWGLAFAALAALCVVAALFAGWQTRRLQRQAGEVLVAEAVSDHVRSLLPGHLIDVRTSDQHTVKPWFDGRVDFSPQVKDLSAQGFELVGGRLDVLAGHPVAALVYRRHQHVINVFQWPAGSGTAGGSRVHDGYHLLEWDQDGLHVIAVSSVAEGDLGDFMRAFRAAPTAAGESAR